MLSFPNLTAFYLSPYFLSFWVGSLHSQLSVWIGLALPKGKLGSCLNRLIYEALKSTTDQKYLLHWPAISAWNSYDKNHPLKVFCRHAWFIWVNKTLCLGKKIVVKRIKCSSTSWTVLPLVPPTTFPKHSVFEVFINVGRVYFGCLWSQKPYFLLQFVSVPSKDQQQLLILLNIYC